MIEETGNSKSDSPEKLLIDNPTDFQFHAAYISYADAFDKTTNPESKKQLNQNIEALQQNKIDLQTFYRNISQYRSSEGSQTFYGRAVITTQKKREWRRKTQKQERIRRHKK